MTFLCLSPPRTRSAVKGSLRHTAAHLRSDGRIERKTCRLDLKTIHRTSHDTHANTCRVWLMLALFRVISQNSHLHRHGSCLTFNVHWLDRIPHPPPHSTPSLLYHLSGSIPCNPQHDVQVGRLAEHNSITNAQPTSAQLAGYHVLPAMMLVGPLWERLVHKLEHRCHNFDRSCA